MILVIEDKEDSLVPDLLHVVSENIVCSCGAGNLLDKVREVSNGEEQVIAVLDVCINNHETHRTYRELLRAGIVVAPIVCSEHNAMLGLRHVKYVGPWTFDPSIEKYWDKESWETRCKRRFHWYAMCGITSSDCCGDNNFSRVEKAEMVRATYPTGTIQEIIAKANCYIRRLNADLPKGVKPLPLQKEK